MNRISLPLTLAVLALAGAAQASKLDGEVRGTYERFRTAVERFDTAAVSKMVVPGLQVHLPNGETLSRAAYLKAIGERQGIAAGTPKHSFTLSGVHESGGFVTAFVRLTLTSQFRDGNQGLHKMQTTERKTITFKREGGGLKVARIDAVEVVTSIDGKKASVLRRS